MPDQPAGRLEPGEARTFEFTATFPDAGEAGFQNAAQGAATTVAYAWLATEVDAVGRGGPDHEERAGGPPVGGGAGDVGGRRAVLELTVPRIRWAFRAGRVVAWTDCDSPCRLTVRGHLRAGADGHHRGARVRFIEKRLAAAGRQRLRIPVSRKLRAWLRGQSPPERLGARLIFTAVGTDGQRDLVRKRVRLRPGRR